jgi:hypothetical protein
LSRGWLSQGSCGALDGVDGVLLVQADNASQKRQTHPGLRPAYPETGRDAAEDLGPGRMSAEGLHDRKDSIGVRHGGAAHRATPGLRADASLRAGG